MKLPAVRSRDADGRTLLDRALDAAFPASCVGCGIESHAVCPACSATLYTRLELPPGTPVGLPSDTPIPLLQLEWCAPFRGVVRSAIHELKYRGERRIVPPLADAMAARARAALVGGSLLVPVPAAPSRVRERGFDHAVLLARSLAARLGVHAVEALERRIDTRPQYELDRAQRRSNVAGAFGLADHCARAVEGSWVVLVDDVVTTGSTLAVAAEMLLSSGAVGVSAITVARER